MKSPTLPTHHRCPVSLDSISIIIIIVIIIFPISTPPRTLRRRSSPMEHLWGVSIEIPIFDPFGGPTSWFAPRQFDLWTRPFGGFPQKSLSFNMAHLEVVETGKHTTDDVVKRKCHSSPYKTKMCV